MKRIIIFIFLLACGKASQPDSDDPSGWGSFYTTESHQHMDAVDVVDPSGWNYDRETKNVLSKRNEDEKKVVNVRKIVLEEENVDTSCLMENEVQDAVKSKIETLVSKETKINDNIAFVKRFISILLNAADLSEETTNRGDDYVSSVVEISTSRERLETLIHFTNSKLNVSLRELDAILSDSIHRKHIPVYNVVTSIETLFFFASQKEIWLPIFLGCVVLGILRLLVTSKTTSGCVTSLLILIFCLAYVVEYYRMYKEVEIRQKIILEKHPEVPSSCNPANRFWLATFIDSFVPSVTFNQNECEQYQKAVLLDPLIEVSPVRVLSSILTDLIVHPFGKIGTAIGDFATAILGGLPVQYGWLVWIISSIGFFLLCALGVVLVINGSLQLSSLFFGVKISRSAASSVTNSPRVPEIANDPATVSQAMLRGVAGMQNPILIDASALGTLLRAQSNAALHHSGVEELIQSSEAASLPGPSDEKFVSRNTEKEPLKVFEESEPALITLPSMQKKLELINVKKQKNSDLNTCHNENIISKERNLDESVAQVENKSVETDEVNEECNNDIVENENSTKNQK